MKEKSYTICFSVWSRNESYTEYSGICHKLCFVFTKSSKTNKQSAVKTSKTILYSIFYYLHVVFLKFRGYFRVLLSAKRISPLEVVGK